MRLGELDAVVLDGPGGSTGQSGQMTVVLLHGFGAPGDDLVPLGNVLGAPGRRLIMPAAPLSLPWGFGDARAWWMIDLARLERALATGEERDLAADVPQGLPAARAAMLQLLDEAERRLGAGRFVLGGFSQGAMLAMDVALHTERPLAGLVLLSGTIVAENEWLPRLPARRGLPVFMSHGTGDPLLPHRAAVRLRDHLQGAGMTVAWNSFDGGHEIPMPVVRKLGTFLAGL